MKILYFYQYFSTPRGAWSTRVYDFSKEWVEKGNEVIIVTSIYSKSDLQAQKFLETQIIDGIKVKIINVRIDNKESKINRIFSFIKYMLFACYYALKIKADVVIASSGPISVGLPGILSKLRSKKFVFEVRDLWPEGAITMGFIRNKYVIKFAYWFEKICYTKADKIVTLSIGMKDDIVKRCNIEEEKIVSVTNGANIKLFDKSFKEGSSIKEFKEKFIAVYTGNIGKVNNSLLLLNTARLLKKRGENEILILLVGDGQQKMLIQEKIIEEELTNIKVLDLMPKIKLIEILKNVSVSLIPLNPSKIFNTSSPNKLFESLAIGLPVIQTTTGWIKDLLHHNNCGFTVSAEKENELAELLISLKNNEELLKEMRKNAIRLAKNEFDKDYLAQKMLNSLIKY